MHTLVHAPGLARLTARALTAVALTDGDLDPRERRWIDLHLRLAGVDTVPEELIPATPDEVAAAIGDPAVRRDVLRQLVALAALDEAVRPEEIAALRAFAAALDVEDATLEQLEGWARGRMRWLSADLFRRGFIGDQLRRTWEDRGLAGMAEWARSASGLPDREKARRYQALGDLPEGTLGRAFHDHFRRHGYALPGEKGGLPEDMNFHDLGHALTGYGTDAHGEVSMAGYEAGYIREDGFGVVMLALFVFHLDAPIPNTTHQKGAFDIEAFEAAFHRGRRLRVDLRRWDPWPFMDRPLDHARAAVGDVSAAPAAAG